MKLTRLLLKNVRCYQSLDLSFEETNDEGLPYFRNRTVILGDNGTGKSTILKSIALILAGSSALGEIIGNPNSWIKKKTKSCEIKAYLTTASEEKREISLVIKRNDNLSKIIARNEASLQQLDDALQHTERNYLTIGYGIYRKVSGGGLSSGTSNFQNFRAENIATLFDAEASLYPFESWVMDLDYRKGKKGLKIIKEALDQLIPDAQFYRIDKKSRNIQFKNRDGIVNFSELSDGFQITANWLGDLLYRITNTYDDYENPLEARFILLIDEVALHLHPAWQRIILQSISKLFPNAQIIITTHSPFVAQQAGPNELFRVIRKKNNTLDLFHYENDPRKLLIHQIIMSDIFGIATDESVVVEKAKNKIRKNPTSGNEAEVNSDNKLVRSMGNNNLNNLSGVEKLEDIPMNKYSHASMDYKKMMDQLKDEIKKMSDDKSK